VLTEKNFNKTVFAEDAKSVVFFNDVEEDDPELDQYECFMQLSAQIMTKRGYNFFTVNTTKEQKLRKQEGAVSAAFWFFSQDLRYLPSRVTS
ncbi:hypothetical protein ANCDUO_26019, partial [Ancylostoma duodenale]